jgi:hypothetical protein
MDNALFRYGSFFGSLQGSSAHMVISYRNRLAFFFGPSREVARSMDGLPLAIAHEAGRSCPVRGGAKVGRRIVQRIVQRPRRSVSTWPPLGPNLVSEPSKVLTRCGREVPDVEKNEKDVREEGYRGRSQSAMVQVTRGRGGGG